MALSKLPSFISVSMTCINKFKRLQRFIFKFNVIPCRFRNKI